MPTNDSVKQFTEEMKHKPFSIQQVHDLTGRGGLQWMHLFYRYEGKKLKGVEKWLVEIRAELQSRGLTVREIKTKVHFLAMGSEPDPDCNVHAEFSVVSAQQLDELNEAFIEAARSIVNRTREKP